MNTYTINFTTFQHQLIPVVVVFLSRKVCYFRLAVLSQRQPCFSEGAVSIRSSTSSSSSNTAGRVEYCFRPSSAGGALFLGIVCNSTFLLNEAHVACRTKHSAYSAYTTLPGAV